MCQPFMICSAALLVVGLSAPLATQAPADGEVPLPARGDWRASLVHDGDCGVWYCKIDDVIDAYGPPEVIATDDRGRHYVMSVYSGRWKEHVTVPDGQWLAPSVSADVDPRITGRELYAAGMAGNVHRITLRALAAARFATESIEIGHVAGEEFHSIVAADLLPERDGDELLVFGITGAVYELVPEREGDAFAMVHRATLPGRVRDTVVVPELPGMRPTIVGTSRSGHLLAMQLLADRLEFTELLHEDCGLGRVAQRNGVLWVTRDDGVLLRVARDDAGSWQREIVLAGDQGLRGVAAGRFFADEGVESVAVFGYGKRVQIVSRRAGQAWRVETIFVGEDKGHWLAVGELDGRNGTDEILASGFDGRVILLSRKPGYGLQSVAVPEDEAAANASVGERPPRIAVVAGDEAVHQLSPLCYQGGFETKTMVYETLVRRGEDGAIVPALAASWAVLDGGRAYAFTLREGAMFHDGSPVTAADVAVHFRRWIGLPEHAWLRSSEHIERVVVTGDRTLRVELDRPWALLPDLCAVNPTAIQAPASRNREGAFVKPVGSGPFAFVGVHDGGRVLRFRERDGAGLVDLVRFGKEAGEQAPVDALLRGEVDVVIGSWLVRVDPARVRELREDPRFHVATARGSSMWHLSMRTDHGPLRDVELRAQIAAAIDRAQLIREVAHGFGDPSTGWAAPSVRVWPQGTPRVPRRSSISCERPLRLDTGFTRGAVLAAAIRDQLVRAGVPVEIVDVSDDWDLRLERTHGVPYDPFTTLTRRFLPPANANNAESPRGHVPDKVMAALVQALLEDPDESSRTAHYARMQAHLDKALPLVPLFAPRRIIVATRAIPLPRLDHDMYALDASWLVAGG